MRENGRPGDAGRTSLSNEGGMRGDRDGAGCHICWYFRTKYGGGMRKETHTGIRVRKRKRDLEIEFGVDGRNGICEGYNGHTHCGQSPRFNYFVLSSVNASEGKSLLPAAGKRYWSIGILARIY
jgi:hypothetical protein